MEEIPANEDQNETPPCVDPAPTPAAELARRQHGGSPAVTL